MKDWFESEFEHERAAFPNCWIVTRTFEKLGLFKRQNYAALNDMAFKLMRLADSYRWSRRLGKRNSK